MPTTGRQRLDGLALIGLVLSFMFLLANQRDPATPFTVPFDMSGPISAQHSEPTSTTARNEYPPTVSSYLATTSEPAPEMESVDLATPSESSIHGPGAVEPGTIRVQVRTSGGAPVVGVDVEVERRRRFASESLLEAPISRQRTGADGDCLFVGVPRGKYCVRCVDPGVGGPERLILLDDEPLRIRLIAEALCRLSVRVTDGSVEASDPVPLSDANVQISYEPLDVILGSSRYIQGSTNSAGSFEALVMCGATLSVLADRAGYMRGAVDSVRGDSGLVELALLPARRLVVTGTLRGEARPCISFVSDQRFIGGGDVESWREGEMTKFRAIQTTLGPEAGVVVIDSHDARDPLLVADVAEGVGGDEVNIDFEPCEAPAEARVDFPDGALGSLRILRRDLPIRDPMTIGPGARAILLSRLPAGVELDLVFVPAETPDESTHLGRIVCVAGQTTSLAVERHDSGSWGAGKR